MSFYIQLMVLTFFSLISRVFTRFPSKHAVVLNVILFRTNCSDSGLLHNVGHIRLRRTFKSNYMSFENLNYVLLGRGGITNERMNSFTEETGFSRSFRERYTLSCIMTHNMNSLYTLNVDS